MSIKAVNRDTAKSATSAKTDGSIKYGTAKSGDSDVKLNKATLEDDIPLRKS